MLELVLCSLFTIVPDYLYRHFWQGKRIGREINLYSVWFELRWGITACLMLTVLMITLIFYFHPSTTSATAFYRTIPILPETSGRVSEVFVKFSADVEKGAPILKLDSSKQDADLEVAKRRIVEIDATTVMARADIAAAEGQVEQAKGAHQQAIDELNTKEELKRRSPGIVPEREIERLQNLVKGRSGTVAAATAVKQAAETRVLTLLPAEKASAEAKLRQAQVEVDKLVVYAGVSGRIEQFTIRVGDVINPLMRPGGILIPADAGRKVITAGFGQLEAQVIKVGMTAEVTCVSKPLTIIPMVVVAVQDYIAAGQVRAGEQLIEVRQVTAPGTLVVFLEPIYESGLDGVTPGSSCIANAYTSNHERLTKESLGIFTRIYLHGIDAVGVVHATILRAQALLLPIKTLVFAGH